MGVPSKCDGAPMSFFGGIDAIETIDTIGAIG